MSNNAYNCIYGYIRLSIQLAFNEWNNIYSLDLTRNLVVHITSSIRILLSIHDCFVKLFLFLYNNFLVQRNYLLIMYFVYGYLLLWRSIIFLLSWWCKLVKKFRAFSFAIDITTCVPLFLLRFVYENFYHMQLILLSDVYVRGWKTVSGCTLAV